MDKGSQETSGLVEFTEEAVRDLLGIDQFTAEKWGLGQSGMYMEFLASTFSSLAKGDERGRPLAKWPELQIFLAKFSGRRMSHGHRVIYREIPGGIRVIRILHTAMDLERHIPKLD